MSDYDYPTEKQLDRIRTWPIEDGYRNLMAYVESIWWMPDWGWHRAARRTRQYKAGSFGLVYRISTGGWSGNESIIDALQDNELFWLLCWEQSRVGGHYIFRVRDVER